MTVSYYDSDLARSVTQNGVTTTYDLDVMDRRSTSTTTEGSDTSTTTRVYEDTSDNPAWATTVKDGVTETTRYVSSIAGDLSLTFSVEDDFLPTGIVDPQGSVVATTSKQTSPNGGTSVVWSGLSLFDEYGNPVTAKTTDTGVLDYGWLGGKERATDATGLVLMGVRLYNSVTGHFTSVDPVTGGNTTRYTYPQDPINKYDLNGKKQHAQLSDAELLAIAKYQRGQPLSKAERSAYNSGMQKIKKNEKYSGERNKQKRANTKKNSGKKGKGNNGKGGGGGSGGIRTFNTPIGTRFSPGGGGTRNLFR